MTTTDVYTGMEDEKSSSRVLKPPGGGSTDIFGSGSVGHSTTNAQQEQRQNAQKAAAGSNIFGGAVNEPDDPNGVKHISRKQQPSSQSAIFGDAPTASELKKRNQEECYTNKFHPETKSKSEEFPVYDRSVYMAQMTPQRRNIQQVSSYNPITNESYDGFDSQDQQQTSLAKRRGLNVNQASNYNVITNQTYDERMAEPSPLKPGRRTVSNNNSSEEGTYNPITGQTIGGRGDDVQKSSSRVLNPPGGKSSGLW